MKSGDWVTLISPEGEYDCGYNAWYEITSIIGDLAWLRRVEWSRFRELTIELEHNFHGQFIIEKVREAIRGYWGKDKEIYYDLKEGVPAYPVANLKLYQTKEQREKWGEK